MYLPQDVACYRVALQHILRCRQHSLGADSPRIATLKRLDGACKAKLDAVRC